MRTCRQVTAGNPFYVGELLIALEDERELAGEQLASRARALAPDAVIRSLRVRVGRLGDPAARLARAVAVLGDDVPLRRAAELAGLALQDASAAADALAAVEVLLAREPLRFVHPLVRRAIEQDIPASQRASRQLDAARLLHSDGADPERVAAHLRAELALQQGHALYAQGLHERAAQAYEAGLGALDDDPHDPEVLELHDALQTAFVATASLVKALQGRAAERSAPLLGRASTGHGTHGQRMLLAQAAIQAAFSGEQAAIVAKLAERSWDGGRLLERETSDGLAWILVTAALTLGGLGRHPGSRRSARCWS